MPRSIPTNLNLASLRLGASLLFLVAPCIAAEDILIADFEGDSYGDWEVTGEAFANRLAQANEIDGVALLQLARCRRSPSR